MLEGNELEGPISDFGKYVVDVDAMGNLKLALEISKEVSGVKIVSTNGVELNVLMLLEMVAKKTSATWDDIVVSKIKDILGIGV